MKIKIKKIKTKEEKLRDSFVQIYGKDPTYCEMQQFLKSLQYKENDNQE